MANDHYVVITVECPRCKTEQKIHVSTSIDDAQTGGQTILCINCDNRFDVAVPDKIIRGPFPA